ncbi:MAG: type II toxin-antitoxin system VapB family antitoxin [Gammaproteobacteria bacterium]|nr:type II toxin-antitoxin system VapB family antitoxin [Gammaproteobacteria bacterium]
MSLNIKNEETCQLVDELAKLIGETKTGAITIALKDRLEREKRLANKETLARHLYEIGRSCAELMGPGPSSTEHGDLLYDEKGLPK